MGDLNVIATTVSTTVFPRIETAVSKDFSSVVPRFQFEAQLLYEGRLLIFRQGCGLLIRYRIAVAHSTDQMQGII